MAPILTAKVGNNADLFPDVLALYAHDGAHILDMTYGKGVFWRQVDTAKYGLVTNDIYEPADTAEDFRHTSHADESFDMVVLDPPYMRTNNTPGIMAGNYQNQTVNLRTNRDVIQYYMDGAVEARRLLKRGGYLVIKCQDEVESRRQRWNHIKLMDIEGFVAEDLFVMVRTGPVFVGRCQANQQHARKNHSWFVILRKL